MRAARAQPAQMVKIMRTKPKGLEVNEGERSSSEVLKRVQHTLGTQIFSKCVLLDEYCTTLSYLNLSSLYSDGTLISGKAQPHKRSWK